MNRPLLVGLAGLWLSGCAHRIANQAGKGMASALQEQQAEADPSRQPSRLMGQRAAAGVIEALDEPEQRERIQRLIDDSVRQTVRAAFEAAPVEELAEQIARAATAAAMNQVALALGPDGRLGASLIATSGRATAAAVDGALGSVRGQLDQRRIQELTRAAGQGFSMGLRDALAWPVVLVSLLAGCLAGILGHRAWAGRRARLKLRTA
jgi:hypothetical protein